MAYLLLFLEGILTFVSPCLLPMLPVYALYFAGDGKKGTGRTLAHALGFVAGFTLVFLALGAFAGSLGSLLVRHQVVFNIVTGAIVVAFGLAYLGVFRLPWLTGMQDRKVAITGFLSAVLFGMVFSISWTPCVGPFLGSALTQASQSASALRGILLLLCFSAGLGIPFVLGAMLIDRLKSVFDFIKRHYGVITKVSGALLIAVGIAIATGLWGRLLALLA